MGIDLKKEFINYLRSQKREWSHDRTLTLGASETFACLRRVWFAKHNTEPDEGYEDSLGATARGSSMENDYVVPALSHSFAGKGDLLYVGKDQHTFISGRLSATPDGMLTNVSDKSILSSYGVPDIESDCFMIEIKSFDPRVNLTEAKPIHVGQVNQQIGLVIENTQYRPKYGIIVYVNASFVDDVRVFAVKYDPDVFESAKLRADLVYSSNDVSSVMAEGKIAGGKDCKFCPYQEKCAVVSAESVPTGKLSGYKDGDEEVLLSLVNDLQSAQVKEKEASTAINDTKEQIKEFMRKYKTGFAKLNDGRTVVYTKSEGRASLDKSKLSEDGIELDKYMKAGKPFETLKILKG